MEKLAKLARRRISLLLAACGTVLACGGTQTIAAQSPPPRLNTESHPACQRLHELLKAEEWRVVVELPSVALLLSRSVQSDAVSACSDELLNWLRSSVEARPIDLTMSLEPRIAALGALSTYAWNEPAIHILIRLLDIDERKALLHWDQRSVLPGPGSREMALGPSPVVSLEAFRAWTAAALVRAHVGRRVGPVYADLLVRHFAKQPVASVQTVRDSVTSLLWPELVRAHELAPNDPRWAGLSAHWLARLQALHTPASECRE